jgi:Domain of unknown function (DUF4335)
MTIRRQYSLPNCTLVLDGLSDGNSTTGTPDSRPLMSSLFNAECHFVGSEQHLFGGRDFLTSLVTTVSNYAQEFLSGIRHPIHSETTNSLVSLVKGDRDNIHHLEAKLESQRDRANLKMAASSADRPTQINLSTVQLFDLLEAIDQFLADKRTLPDIVIPLKPVSKAIAQPISAQAVPAGLGLASLVAASLIGYALPAPKVSAPSSLKLAPVVQPSTAPTTPKPTTTTSPVTPASPTSSQPPPSSSPDPFSTKTGTILEATQIGFLERKLQRDLNQNWLRRDRVKRPVNFLVNVNQDGQIVNYQPTGRTNAVQSTLTPLPRLSTKSTDPNQALGNFRVVFRPTGVVEIKPTGTLQGDLNLGSLITEPQLKATLATQLQTTLRKSLAIAKPLSPQNLNYRVAVTKTGEIVDYEPTDLRAYRSEAKTPLPKLAKFNPQAAISQEPLAQYKVVFQPNGKILVTPK